MFRLRGDKSWAKLYNHTPKRRDTLTMDTVHQDTAAELAQVRAKCRKPV